MMVQRDVRKMEQVALIGTVMLDMILQARNGLEFDRCNKVDCTRSPGGSMHNVAWHCGLLDMETHFVGKFGRDEIGLELYGGLQKNNVFVYGPTLNLDTPVFFSVQSEEKQMMLSSIRQEFLFDDDQDIPYCIVQDCAWGVTDQIDSNFLLKLCTKAKKTQWIFSGQVPDSSVLPYFTGIIVNRREMGDYAQNQSVQKACQELLALGIQWIILTLDEEGAVLYEKSSTRYFPALGQGVHSLGCGDGFLSGLLYGLTHHGQVATSIAYAMKAAAILLSEPAALNSHIIDIMDTMKEDRQDLLTTENK